MANIVSNIDDAPVEVIVKLLEEMYAHENGLQGRVVLRKWEFNKTTQAWEFLTVNWQTKKYVGYSVTRDLLHQKKPEEIALAIYSRARSAFAPAALGDDHYG